MPSYQPDPNSRHLVAQQALDASGLRLRMDQYDLAVSECSTPALRQQLSRQLNPPYTKQTPDTPETAAVASLRA